MKGRPRQEWTPFPFSLMTQSGHALVVYVQPLRFIVLSALSISLRITGSSIVAGMIHGSPSAIFFIVPRRTLPERVFGSLETVIVSLKAARG